MLAYLHINFPLCFVFSIVYLVTCFVFSDLFISTFQSMAVVLVLPSTVHELPCLLAEFIVFVISE